MSRNDKMKKRQQVSQKSTKLTNFPVNTCSGLYFREVPSFLSSMKAARERYHPMSFTELFTQLAPCLTGPIRTVHHCYVALR